MEFSEAKIIIGVFVILAALSLGFIILGFNRPEVTGATLLGFTILFVLGVTLFGTGIEYQSGDIRVMNYNYNGSVVSDTTETITSTYSAYTSLPIGILLATIAGVGFGFTLFFMRSEKW